MNFTGNLDLGSGTYNCEINGTGQGTTYDLLAVSGAVTIGASSKLNVTFGYNPTLGSAFTIITGGSVSGSFSSGNVTVTGGNVTAYTVFVVGNTVVLTVNAVLPVELIAFNGIPTVSGNLLTWATANELNNKGFQIERLTDKNEWLTLGFVAANNQASLYAFTDKTPLHTSYYRLRQIDNNGNEAVSKIISIQSKGAKNKFTVYPNPTSAVLNFVADDINTTYEVIDLLGQIVLKGNGTAPIDVSALPKGSYVLKVGSEQVKFLKQ